MRPLHLFLILLLLPGSLAAQGEGQEEPFRARGTAALMIKAGSVAGADRVFLGGWGGLTFGPRFSVGGGGVALTRSVELTASDVGTGFQLGAGYGGILFRFQHPLGRGVRGQGSLLVGAGHAEVRDRLTGREVGADNFGILEPEVGISLSILPWLFIEAAGGRRMAWWLEDLPLLREDDLTGTTGTLSIRVGGH